MADVGSQEWSSPVLAIICQLKGKDTEAALILTFGPFCPGPGPGPEVLL